ncbi:MAG: beta-ketoacyl-[acyl-carrier-protein] synthase [Verrucomicrobiota bacterium]|jgi:3-oxoacyl-[acyl-carrier-protein] synthase II
MQLKRIVITGTGILSSIGNNTQEFWEALLAGRSGIAPITQFNTEGHRVTFAGEVKGFNPTDFVDAKEAQKLDRFVQLAIGAAEEAVAQAGLKNSGIPAERIGCNVGSGIGGLKTIEAEHEAMLKGGARRIGPMMIPKMIVDMAAGYISIRHGFKGPNFAVVSACATATHSIGEAFWILQRGDADVMVCGGAEAAITPLGIGGFASMRALSTRNDAPQAASRPFDKDRDGFVMGEGAGILVLETLESAQTRGAKIIAELIGYGATADANHITAPAEDGAGAAAAIRMALGHAKISPDAISYINAHGTSTPFNDKFETVAIKSVLGDHARKVAISSTKSMTGHTLGAAGGLETIVCALACQHDVVPPTINYTTPDPDCDLDYVPNAARKVTVDVALNINLGFGGHNAVSLVRKFK